RIKTDEKQHLLELTDVGTRLREISVILNRELEVVELGSKIQSQVQSEMEKGQREYFLRQQLKAIQEELGEGDAEQAEVNELRDRLAELELPDDVRKAVDRELGRLEKLPSSGHPPPARPRSASRSRARSNASSRASPSAASVTRPRSAATAAPTSARCRARSSAPSATQSRATR